MSRQMFNTGCLGIDCNFSVGTFLTPGLLVKPRTRCPLARNLREFPSLLCLTFGGSALWLMINGVFGGIVWIL